MKKDMLMMAMMMNNNSNNANNPLGSMLPLMLMSEGKDDDDMLPMLLMMSNNSANNSGFNPMMLLAMGEGNSDFPPEILMGDQCVAEISIIHNLVISKPKFKALSAKLYLDVLKKHNKLNKTTIKYITHNRIDLLKNYLSLGIEDNVDVLHSIDEV